jgi:hypothetical protein
MIKCIFDICMLSIIIINYNIFFHIFVWLPRTCEMAMVKDNRTRSYTGYYCILSTTRAFIHLPVGHFAQGAALVANAL